MAVVLRGIAIGAARNDHHLRPPIFLPVAGGGLNEDRRRPDRISLVEQMAAIGDHDFELAVRGSGAAAPDRDT
jgi:hypothetical protein